MPDDTPDKAPPPTPPASNSPISSTEAQPPNQFPSPNGHTDSAGATTPADHNTAGETTPEHDARPPSDEPPSQNHTEAPADTDSAEGSGGPGVQGGAGKSAAAAGEPAAGDLSEAETGRVDAEADSAITAHTDAVAGTQRPEPGISERMRALDADDPTPDPLLDLEQRRREAGVDKLSPFGRPGQPLGKTHPFVFGFTAALGVISAWLLVEAVINARQVIVWIVVSMFLAVGLNPAVERLQKARLPRGGAVAVVFLGLVAVFVGVGFAVIPPLTEQITNFVDHLPTYIDQLGKNQRIQELDREYQILQKAQDAVTNANFGQSAIGGVVGVGRVVVGGIFSALTVLILTLYLLSSLPTIKTFFYRLAPRSRRARVALLGDEILLRIGGYVAGTITVAFIAGTTAYIFLSIMGIPFTLPLALFVGLTALIPLVGATVGATLACTVAFFDGMYPGIACVIFFIIYQQVENYIIHPRVMKRAVDVQPAVTIIAALIGGTLLGIVGALLAIPTAAALALIIREVVVPRQDNL